MNIDDIKMMLDAVHRGDFDSSDVKQCIAEHTILFPNMQDSVKKKTEALLHDPRFSDAIKELNGLWPEDEVGTYLKNTVHHDNEWANRLIAGESEVTVLSDLHSKYSR